LPEIEWVVLNGDGTGESKMPGVPDTVTKHPTELENYVCSSPKDLEKLINACKGNK